MSDHRLDSSHPCPNLPQSLDWALSQLAAFGQRRVRAEIDADNVILKGVVRSYYYKQLAQESIRSVPGVTAIRNEIIVAPTLLPADMRRGS